MQILAVISHISLFITGFFKGIIEHHETCRYNAPFILIMSIIGFNFILERVLTILNSRKISTALPNELSDVYDSEQYSKSQQYKKVNERFSLITSTFSFILIVLMLTFHVFGYFDQIARSVTSHPILVAMLFFGMIMLASDILNTPFALYDTFIIEEKFGFNKTTLKTFFLDKIKGWLIAGILGGGVTALIIWFYLMTEEMFWVYAWIAVTAVMIFITMFYSTLIVPLFNKQTPLEDGPLRQAIQEFCKKVDFKLDNIYVIDGSKRSTKSNAYFTGLGPEKRIVLYDTLIEDLEIDEIVAVLAHEIGHYKKKHSLTNILIGVIQTGITLYIFSLFTVNPMLSWALGAKVHSIHMVILAFGVIYSPITTVVGLGLNILSRTHEFQADRYTKNNYDAGPLISALKKLSSKNLSNLTPHPAYVFFHYSHPTLLQRIRTLNK
ncbi:MAG: M48 family metallopeptidase [Bacteroidales bacterium]|nr:M48 family metallopeptidase [Bacteroidales bacterium]